jgi:hypothetical protein
VCLRGASEVHDALLATQPQSDTRLRAYVVWVPKSEGAREDVADATEFVPDARARHFWDGNGALMAAYTQVLSLGEDAWDIYMVYGPEERWTGALPPAPAYWMHQLGPPETPRVHGPYLDAATFAARVRALLPAAP